MHSHRPKLIACHMATISLAFGACIALAAPPDLPLLPPPEKAPPPAKAKPRLEVTRIPVEFRLSVADLEKQMLRAIVEKIDPKAKPELPIVVKGNGRDLRAKVAEQRAAQDAKQDVSDAKDAPKAEAREPEKAQSRSRVVVLPAQPQPVQPVMQPDMLPRRPRLLGRPPLGYRMVERAVLRPAIATLIERFAEIPDLDYRIELRSFKLAVSGQTLTCELGGAFHSEEKAGPPRPGNPPPVVRGDITIKLTVTKELIWSDTGKLELKEGTSQVWIDPDAPIVGFPRLDIVRVIQLNGLLTLLNGVVDRQVMKQLTGENMPDLTTVAPRVKEKLPFFALAEITAYPLHSDGKDLYIPLVVGLVPSNKKTDDEVLIATKTETPPEPKLRGRIIFKADGKPDVKLDPVK